MNEWKAQLYNISDDELDSVVWRYLTFPKFISMISYGALWFCRLDYLKDEFEGVMPYKTVSEMKKENERWKPVFSKPELQKQLDEMPKRNVEDGKVLTAVNCWFLGVNESLQMWNDYVGAPEGVVVKSTIRKVRDSVYLPSEMSFIGKVKYVDFDKYEMSTYEGSQAHHRAFLKDRNHFDHENEIRMQTMNLRSPACLDPFGRPLSREDIIGKGMNNLDEPGLHVRVDLNNLFDTIITAPGAQKWFINLIKHIQIKSGFKWMIECSQFKTLRVE